MDDRIHQNGGRLEKKVLGITDMTPSLFVSKYKERRCFLKQKQPLEVRMECGRHVALPILREFPKRLSQYWDLIGFQTVAQFWSIGKSFLYFF